MASTTGDGPYFVFVYGTLTDPTCVEAVLPEFTFHGPAVLDGLHRVAGRYPTLAPDGTVDGRLLETAVIEPLDAYEGVHAGLYVRLSVPVAGAFVDADTVDVYVGDPALLDAPVTWPGTGPFVDRARAYMRDTDVRLRPP